MGINWTSRGSKSFGEHSNGVLTNTSTLCLHRERERKKGGKRENTNRVTALLGEAA